MAETLLELEARLLQAKEARHKLLTGAQEITVSLHGYGATTYSQANIAGLERYINEICRPKWRQPTGKFSRAM
jgi:hypothetical protein